MPQFSKTIKEELMPFTEEQLTPAKTSFEIMQETRTFDKRLGYCDAVMDLIDLVTKMGLDNETVMNIQSKMVEKMGKYQRPSPNAYDHLENL